MDEKNNKHNKIVIKGEYPPLKILNKNNAFLKMLLRGVPFDLLAIVSKRMAQVEKIQFEEDGTRKEDEHGNYIGRRAIDFRPGALDKERRSFRIIAERTDSVNIEIISACDLNAKDENIGYKVQRLMFDLTRLMTVKLTANDISTMKGGNYV